MTFRTNYRKSTSVDKVVVVILHNLEFGYFERAVENIFGVCCEICRILNGRNIFLKKYMSTPIGKMSRRIIQRFF